MRFASVYRSFSSIEDFEREIADLRKIGLKEVETWTCLSRGVGRHVIDLSDLARLSVSGGTLLKSPIE